MIKVLILTMLLLQGCAFMHPPPPKLPVRGNGMLKDVQPPPSPRAYVNPYVDNEEFYQFVDDYNWYLNYTFVNVIMLNNYAETRGWVPSIEKPVCKLVLREPMLPLPEFEPENSALNDSDAYEWELVNYIKVLKQQYQDRVDSEAAIEEVQKRLCAY